MPHSFNDHRFRKLLRIYPSKALELLYDEYHNTLKTLATQLTRDADAAEDIVQETFVHVWQECEKLRSHQLHIRHYLVKVVRNKSINYYRERLRTEQNNQLYMVSDAPRITTNPIEHEIIKKEMIEKAKTHIDAFPRREKECLVMRIFGEMTPSQIASDLNVTIKAVERSLTCANKRLRRVMAT